MRLGYFDINGNVLPSSTKVTRDLFGTISVLDASGKFVANAYDTAEDAAYWKSRTQAAIVQAQTYGVTVGAGQTVQQAVTGFQLTLHPVIPTTSATVSVVATPHIVAATTTPASSAQTSQADANMAAVIAAMSEIQTTNAPVPATPAAKSSSSGIGLLSIIGIAVSLFK